MDPRSWGPPPIRAIRLPAAAPPPRLDRGAPPHLRLILAHARRAIALDVLEAVQAWFLDQPALRAATSDGALWLDEAPQDTRFPYAVAFLVSELDDEVTTGDYKIVRSIVQLSLADSTSRGARRLRLLFEAAFDQAPLRIADRPVLFCLPGSPTASKGMGKGLDGADWWLASVDLEILWWQTKPIPT